MIVTPDKYVHIRHRECGPEGPYSPYSTPYTYPAIKLVPPTFRDGLCRIVIGDKETSCKYDDLLAAVLDLRTLLPEDKS